MVTVSLGALVSNPEPAIVTESPGLAVAGVTDKITTWAAV
jgi:hypothetical protein